MRGRVQSCRWALVALGLGLLALLLVPAGAVARPGGGEGYSGGGDGGKGSGGGTDTGPNPFKEGPTFNMTEQMKLRKTDPAKAKRLAMEAGKVLPA